jgi:hypothetical protein
VIAESPVATSNEAQESPEAEAENLKITEAQK